MTGARLRLAKIDSNHIPEVMGIAGRCFTKAWSRGDFAYFLSHACRVSLGIFADLPDGQERPQLVAYFIGVLVQGELDIVSIATAPEARRLGIGETLLKAACAEPGVKKAFLEVDVANSPAIALYEKLGFSVLGKRKAYYEGKHDALVMQREAVL